jgi:hypothetical protein
MEGGAMNPLDQDRRIADLERTLESLLELFDANGNGHVVDPDRIVVPYPDGPYELDEFGVEVVDLAREVLWGGAAEVEE